MPFEVMLTKIFSKYYYYLRISNKVVQYNCFFPECHIVVGLIHTHKVVQVFLEKRTWASK